MKNADRKQKKQKNDKKRTQAGSLKKQKKNSGKEQQKTRLFEVGKWQDEKRTQQAKIIKTLIREQKQQEEHITAEWYSAW